MILFQVEKDDGLPESICLSCESNLEVLNDFKKSCFQNDETVRQRLIKCVRIKVEEVLLDDLDWKDADTNLLGSDRRNQEKLSCKDRINIVEKNSLVTDRLIHYICQIVLHYV